MIPDECLAICGDGFPECEELPLPAQSQVLSVRHGSHLVELTDRRLLPAGQTQHAP